MRDDIAELNQDRKDLASPRHRMAAELIFEILRVPPRRAALVLGVRAEARPTASASCSRRLPLLAGPDDSYARLADSHVRPPPDTVSASFGTEGR